MANEHYKYITIDIDQLKPYENNARTHSASQVKQIQASIEEFGFTNPLLIDGENNLIAGHGRLEAAQGLGIKELPCIVVDGLTEDQRKALVISDNQLALNADWDIGLLKEEILDLQEKQFDVGLLGFEDDFLNQLLEDAGEEVEGLTEDDEVPEEPEEPISKPGDIWVCGTHRVMCGDSTSVDDVDKLMGGEKADLVFTDPPYGVKYQSNRREKKERFDCLQNDDQVIDICPILDIFSDGWVFVWSSWKIFTKWIAAFDGFGYPTNIIIWSKGGGGIGGLTGTFSSDYEVALVWNRGAKITGKRIGSVWSIGKDSASSYVHPTQKPVALAEEAIDKTSTKKSLVLDLFGGSGSTLIACEKTGRKSRLMELEPKYVDVIVKRWENFTGEKAALLK